MKDLRDEVYLVQQLVVQRHIALKERLQMLALQDIDDPNQNKLRNSFPES
jgi:hypothetical protein